VLNKTGPQSIHILRGVRQQQDEPGRFSICSRQAAVVRVLKGRFIYLSWGLNRHTESGYSSNKSEMFHSYSPLGLVLF
ncbi:hypothetical protein ACWJUC_23815, partial [Escherichia coli]